MAEDENGKGGVHTITGVDMKKPESKVDDVYNSVQSFGSLMAVLTAMTGGIPIPALMGAQWLGVYLHKLVEWGAITADERNQVLARMEADKNRMQAEMRAEQEARDRGEEPDENGGLNRFLEQFGI